MSFAFIIPVVHPKGNQVSDYGHVEIALKKTLESLQRQTYKETKVVVVCCQMPTWARQMGDNVHFLDVSNSDVFAANRNMLQVDKGLKYILGILYASEHFQPSLYMLADADDYVETRLAEYSLKSLRKKFGNVQIDGYLIDKGLQVQVSALPHQDLNYQNAYLVKRFDAACGTCRILKEKKLSEKLLQIHPNLFEASRQWFSRQQDNIFIVPPDFSSWLDNLCKDGYLQDWHIVNVLGRHIAQQDYFNFMAFPKVGAAKACGHGNHVGPLRGKLHDDKIISKLPIGLFKECFGLRDKGLYSPNLFSDFVFRMAFYFN